MEYLLNNFFKNKSFKDYGFFLFLSGIFFLPSTLFVGLLFLLPSAIIGSFSNKNNYFKDLWNYPFLIFGILISISTISQNFFLVNNYEEIWDPKLSIYGLGNWLPFIWLFWAFQPYIDSKSKKRSFALALITGTFPVLLTGFGQYFFNWHGPFETLNGLIIWYQRPIINPGGLSGLFNNQNYAGSWLNLAWPFCIALFLELKNNIFRRTIVFGFVFSIGFAAFLTYSRNAWLGLLTTLPIIIGKKGIIFLLSVFIIFTLILFFSQSSIYLGDIKNYLINFLPDKVLLEFSKDGYRDLDVSRLEILKSATNLIILNPLFGIGAASFPAIYFAETNFWKGHSHNLLFELAISYGIPSAIILFIILLILIILSGKKIFLNKKINNISIFDKAFWSALFVFLISQMVDIQYYDGKISIIVWILIAGLKNIIEGENNKNTLSKF